MYFLFLILKVQILFVIQASRHPRKMHVFPFWCTDTCLIFTFFLILCCYCSFAYLSLPLQRFPWKNFKAGGWSKQKERESLLKQVHSIQCLFRFTNQNHVCLQILCNVSYETKQTFMHLAPQLWRISWCSHDAWPAVPHCVCWIRGDLWWPLTSKSCIESVPLVYVTPSLSDS